MRYPVLAALLLSAPAGAVPKKTIMTTGPQAKGPGACGVKILPLAEGNEWTYEAVAAPTPPTDPIKRLSPNQAKKIVISVKTIDAKKGADTVITLEEKITSEVSTGEKQPKVEERTLTTTITCDGKKKFEISPDSFFFAGEPGGYFGLKIESYEHTKGTSLDLVNGGIGDKEWREEVVLKWTRQPTPGSDAKLGSGKLELEHSFTPQQPEGVVTKLGSYSAEKLALIITGRVTLDGASPDAKPMELPANWLSTLWLADKVGVVQTLNAYSHMYQLVDAKLK